MGRDRASEERRRKKKEEDGSKGYNIGTTGRKAYTDAVTEGRR